MEKNLRIFLALVLSITIVFGGKYLLNPSNLKKLFSFRLFKPAKFSTSPNFQNSSYSFAIPTFPTLSPRPTAPVTFPTKNPSPTFLPTPTKLPIPTKPVIGNTRPGSSIKEIADLVQKYTCTPASLIMAAKTLETGSSFLNADSSTIEKYNTYNWWNNASTSKEICSGYAYDAIKGTIPSDSKFAGTKCANPLGNQNYPYAIMGIIPLDDAEQNAYIDDYKKVFNTNLPVDRRVFFDAMMLAGFHFKNISLERSDDCDSWGLKYITKVACKYQGGCNFTYQTGSTRSGDYCYLLCEKYNEYAGTSYNCSSTGNYVDASCNFK